MGRLDIVLFATLGWQTAAFRDGYRCGHNHSEHDKHASVARVVYHHELNDRDDKSTRTALEEEDAHHDHDHDHHDHHDHHEHDDENTYYVSDSHRRLTTTVAPNLPPSAWKTFANASSAGETRPLKMWVEWGNVEGATPTDPAQCTSAGAGVDPSAAWPQDSASPAMACSQANVVTAAKIALAKTRLSWLQTYVGQLVTVKSTAQITVTPTQGLGGNVLTVNGGTAASWELTDYDLIIIMTMRPSHNDGIAGYAKCLAYDTFRRCVVGQFNWAPAVLDVATGNMPDVISKDRTTALHEVIHVLGGIKADSFRNPSNGEALPAAEIFSIPSPAALWNGVERYEKLIITPKVKAKARDQFKCATLEGIPLEDQETGANAHWEARVMGPEVMSYGSGTGESYLSDLTIAFLEDTGHYIGNYSAAGRLLPVSANEYKTSSIRTTEVKARDDNVAEPRSPGYIRWGRHAGCKFVTGTPDDWKQATGDQYVCEKNLAYGCTPDNRMSAVCSLPTYGSGPTSNPATKKYNVVCDENQGGASCAHSKTNPAPYLLPAMYQYDVMGAAQPTGGFSAGFNDAMDYAPVRMGYWNCQDVKPSTTNGAGASSDSNESFPVLEKAMDAMVIDMQSFGGQTQCANCRCFESSLMEAYQGFNPMFPKYGLCYRANCYTKDYLQFGIDGFFGTTWYACDPAGGKMYIPGFTGSLHCPKATTFCDMEDPSGILYGETSLWFVWLIWGAIIGVPTILLLVCCGGYIGSSLFCRAQRDAMIARCKNFCGMDLPVSDASVHHLDVNGKKRRGRKWNAWCKKNERTGKRESDVFGARLGDVPGVLCCVEDILCCSFNLPFFKFPCAAVYWKSCWSYLLYAANFIVVPTGVCLGALCIHAYFGGVVYDTFARQMPVWATIAGILVALGVMGLRQAHNDESSLSGILYVYVWVVLAILLILVMSCAYFLESFIDSVATRQWPLIKPYAPDSYQNLTGVRAIARAHEQATEYMPLIVLCLIIAFATMVVIIISAAFITTLKVLAKNSLLMLSIVEVLLAGLLITLGIVLSTGNDKNTDGTSGTKMTTVTVWQVLVLTIVPSLITIVCSVANICIFIGANTCPWPCMPGGDCWPGAKARKAKLRLKMKRLQGQGKAIPLPCRKHWGPQLAVFILIIIQIVPELVCMAYMYASSDTLSENIDTDAAAASMNKLNVFSIALGESDVKSLVSAGIYLLASVSLAMMLVHLVQLLGVSHLLMINTKRCLRRCKTSDDDEVVQVQMGDVKNIMAHRGKRSKSQFSGQNNFAPRRHPKEQIRAGETVLV